MTLNWMRSKIEGFEVVSQFASNASFWFQTIVWVVLIYLLTAVPVVKMFLRFNYSLLQLDHFSMEH